MNTPEPEGLSRGRFAYDGLERIFHEKARLSLLTSLMAQPEGLSFNDLKTACDLTDGNLSRHLQLLSEAGLVEIQKGGGRGRPQTRCRLSPEGRKRFLQYLACLESVVADALGKAGAPTATGWLKGYSPA